MKNGLIMQNYKVMKNYIKYICLFLMVIGTNGNAWGTDETLSLDGSWWTDESYETSSGSKETSAGNSIGLAWTDTYQNSYIQMKKNSGELHSTTFPSTNIFIKSITVTVQTNTAYLYGSTDLKTWTSITFTSGSAVNVESSKYKYFKVTSTSSYCQVSAISVTYTAPTPHTITFNPQGGTCETSTSGSVTSYTLPAASPSPACVAEGWGFYGWATARVSSETPTAPTIVGKAGDTYYPPSDITLHAVYARGEYTKVNSITSGEKYLIASEYNSHNYIMTTDVILDPDDGYYYLDAALIDETSSNKYHAAAVNVAWLCTFTSTEGGYYIQNSSGGYIDTYYDANWFDHTPLDEYDIYTITFTDYSCTINNKYGTYPALVLFDNETFGQNSTTYPMMLYKATSTPYYYSNPSCCDKIVELSKGTQTNATISSFSSDDVATCSSTAADRNVTITVAAATGYKFESTARLTFAKTSGTATATYVSGPTGTGPYTWVYRFAQNDNGTGTFSVTSATPKTYTVTLNGNEATSAGSPATVTATYNSSTLSSAITNPSRTGYTFAGWNTKSDGTGYDVISTSGTLNASKSGYTDASNKWIKDANVELYAKWTTNRYKISVEEVDDVVITATDEEGNIEVSEGANRNVLYGNLVELEHGDVSNGKHWCGWKITNESGVDITATVGEDVDGAYFLYMPAYAITISAKLYTDFTFSCADLQLDEPDNGADNVLSDVIYLTSTSGEKVRSAAHFHVHGDGLTASQTVKFTTGDDDLDELYTFRKADGTEVATNSSGTVNEEVYIFYQPTATTDGRDLVTSVKAYVEKASASNNKPKAVVNEERTINGRHLPSQFIIAAKSGGVWYALPADASVTGAQMGYTFTPDNATTPTKATVAPSNASYAIYAPTADATNKSYVRFAATSGNKALWSNNSSSKVGIKNNAVISGGSAKGNQYEWRLDNTAASAYKLWNNAANAGSGRFLGMDGTTWNMYAAGGAVVHDLRILPVDSWSDYIGLEATDWEESAFSFNITSGTPPTSPTLDHVQVAYNGNTYDASISGSKLTITDDDFADAGGFTAAPGTQLIVEWCSASAVLAQGSLISPIIIKTNTVNLSDYDTDALVKTDIFVTNGAKLTVSENTTVHDVTVNAGSTLLVDKAGESTGATLTMSSGKLTLRGGWTTIGGDSKYDMPRVYINPLSSLAKTNTTINLYMDIFKSEDGKHYYPFAVPFAVAVNDVKYVDPTLAAAAVYNKHYVIKRYNGAKRAENGTGDSNWEVVPAGSILKPGEGYIITAVAVGGKAQLVVPMKNVTNSWLALGEQATVSDSTKNVIKVTAHTGTATAGGGANNRHKGWNMVGVPFMSCYTSGTDMYSGVGSADLMSGRMELSGDVSDPYAWETSDVVYVSVPTHDFSEYIQTDITTAQLVPGWSFFIQVGTTGNLTFLTTKQAESSSTPLYAPQREISPIVKTGIVLTGGEKSDNTTLIISDKYSSDYEVGADLEKMFGNGFTLAAYSITNGTMLAFNAMSTEDAKQLIPIGVRLPADGEYTFALNSRYADADIERLDLIDYETGTVTNLLMCDYTFTATSCQNDERFALNVVTMQKVATGHDQLQTDVDGARKIIMDDKLFIIRDGLLYDATGKRVYNINK